MSESFKNLYEMIRYHAEKNPDQISHIYRDQMKRELSITYGNLFQSINIVASGLISLGMEPQHKMALISQTCYEWALMDLSLLSIGAVDVPRGTDTPGAELTQIIKHAQPQWLAIQTFADLERLIPKKDWNSFQKIIVMSGEIPRQFKRVMSLAELFRLGEENLDKNYTRFLKYNSNVDRETLATLIYTSGTTGESKGVMLTHGNFLHDLEIMTPELNTNSSDVWLALLPLWHAFERTGEYMSYFAGSTIVYSGVNTVSNDMKTYRPTYMNGVPKLYMTVKDKILREINKKNTAIRKLMHLFLRGRKAFILARCGLLNQRFIRRKEDLHPSFGERLPYLIRVLMYSIPALVGYGLFYPVRKKLGGRIRALISGGGSLPVDVDLFFWALGIPLINAYGATEASPGISGRNVNDFIPGTIGKPFRETEITIRNEEGMILPRGTQGEIWVRGKQIMRGYYKEPELTRQVLTEDGWYRTGDLGIMSFNDHLKITGRKKSIIVLNSGENILPEPIEEALQNSPFIQMSVIVGQDEGHLGALIIPFFENIYEHLKAQGKTAVSKFEEWEKNINLADIQKLIDNEIHKLVNKNAQFKPFERIKKFKILHKDFQVGEELTQTLKVKRQVIHKKYKDLINDLYGKKGNKKREK